MADHPLLDPHAELKLKACVCVKNALGVDPDVRDQPREEGLLPEIPSGFFESYVVPP